jgi:nucleoside-diphosphate-sugar epimerase/predicted dehydrogenase
MSLSDWRENVPSDAKTYRQPAILILGAGRVVSDFYLPALAGLGLTDCAKVTDCAPEQLAQINTMWQGVRAEVGDFRGVLERDANGAASRVAIVALPNVFHVEACLLAIAAGYDVLCDKPLALHAHECESIFAASSQAGRIVDVNMCRRYLPSMVAMRRALRDGVIGDLVSVDLEDGAPYGWSPATSAPFHPANGGVLADMGVHYLDLIEHLVGPLKPRAYWDDFEGGVEANAILELKTESDIPVSVKLSRTRELCNQLVVRGSRGMLVAFKDEFSDCLWISNSGVEARLKPESPFIKDWPPTLLSCFAQKILDFLKAVHDRSAPGTSARNAVSVISTIEWAYAHRLARTSTRYRPRPELARGRAVVTGGTGFIGSHLVGRLAEIGFDEITVPIRRVSTCSEVARYPILLERADLLDRKRILDIVKGARWVFHLAYGRDGVGSDRTTIEGTRNVVEAAITARCECVVVLSTMCVFGDAAGIVDEAHPYRPKGGRYGVEKAAMERWCLARSATSFPTRIVVLNPTCVYGPGGGTYSQFPHRLAKLGEFCWIEGGRGIANYCFVDNVVDAILLAAGTADGHGQRFIINDGTSTWREFLDPLLGNDSSHWPSLTARQLIDLHRSARPRWMDALHAVAGNRQVRDVLKARMPTSAAIKFLRRIRPEFFNRLHPANDPPRIAARVPEIQPSLPPMWLLDWFGPTTTSYSSARAGAVLGWRPTVTLAEGQKITARWLAGDEFTPHTMTSPRQSLQAPVA